MNIKPLAAWTLAFAALAAGWLSYGWRGLVLAFTVIVFWLLLQFSRALRALRKAAGAPVGHVDSAVMLHSRLREGMTLAQVLVLTRSLGNRVADRREAPAEVEAWRWSDAGGVTVLVELNGGKVSRWQLERPPRASSAGRHGPKQKPRRSGVSFRAEGPLAQAVLRRRATKPMAARPASISA
jgi:hypothetical protein